MTRVDLTVESHVAHVTMTRGDKMNALDPEMMQALVETGEGLMAREDIRAVVLSGEGRSFCAGLDVASFGGMAGGDPEALLMPRTHGDANLFQQVALVWRKLPVPVVAAVQGVCIGGGLQIALGADIRVAAPDLQMSVMELKWGIVPDMGGMVTMRRLVRGDVIRRLTYTHEMFGAEAARDWGFVTEIAEDPLARARALAAEIASKSPSAIRAAKRLIEMAEDASSDEVLLAESREQVALMGKPHMMEAVMAGMQKRAPKFD